MTSPQTRDYLRYRFGDQLPVPGASKMAPAMPYGSLQGTMGYQAGNSLAQAAEGRRFLKPLGRFMTGLGRDHLGSAASGALVGGIAGLGSGVVQGKEHPLRRAVIGAGLGAGGALLLSKLMEYRDNQDAMSRGLQKRAFYGMPGGPGAPNPNQFIQTALFHDISIPPGDKSMLAGMLPNLNMNQTQQLSDMLRNTSAATSGFLIAKYMFKCGLGGSALAALVSGVAGAITGGNPRNAFGQRVDTHYDALGRQRLVS